MDLSDKIVQIDYLMSIATPPSCNIKLTILKKINDNITNVEGVYNIKLDNFYYSQEDPNLLAEIQEKLSAI